MSNLEKINVLTKDRLNRLDLTQYPNQIFGTTDEVAEGGASGVVDSELSETSENPVQNKVITNKLNSLIGRSKNLLSLVGSETRTFGGATIKRNNCEFVISGTTSNDGLELFQLNSPVLLSAGKSYAFSVRVLSGTMSVGSGMLGALHVGLQDVDGNSVVSGYDVDAGEEVRIVTPSEDVYVQTAVVYTSTGNTFNNYTIAFQLEEGTERTDYEPYSVGLLSKDDIQPHILTAKMIAYHHPSQNGVLEVLPLIEHKRIGSKLSVNSSGGIVIGDGVKTIKASALARSNFAGYSGSMRLDICKNRTWYAGGRAVQNGTILNIVTLSIEPILIEVESGDIITLEFRRDDSSYAHVEGYAVPITTYMTVEVVE